MSRHNASRCPHCTEVIEASTSISERNRTPKEGDISICFYCGGCCTYGPGLVLQVIELEAIEEQYRPIVQRARELILQRYS